MLRHVAIDMTPLLAGGDNGGAGVIAATLVSQLSRIAPDCEFVLLTSAVNHHTLEAFDRPNTRRLNIDTPRGDRPAPDSLAQLQERMRLLAGSNFDLLFCPFHVPPWFHPQVPIVSILYDLQYRYYPEFFTKDQRLYRERQLSDACRLSDRLICVSEHARQTILENGDICLSRTVTIPASIFGRLSHPTPSTIDQDLKNYGLRPGRFLLYPANFWPHKNHRVLLASMRLYQTLYPESDLKLVCPGAPSDAMNRLRDAAAAMGMTDRVLLPGYVGGDAELPSLFAACLALIFPSLYEGFGVPVLEAMSFGRPVLCSNVTSLPEVVGQAALFFDPTKPLEIAHAIARLEQSPELAQEIIRKGAERITQFPDPKELARQYLQVFRDAARSPRPIRSALYGVYEDGWTSQRVVVTYPGNLADRQLEIKLSLPGDSPYEQIQVAVADGEDDSWDTAVILRGETRVVQRAVPKHAGYVQLLIDPTFQPFVQRGADDYRVLGCICQSARILSIGDPIDLLTSGHLEPMKA